MSSMSIDEGPLLYTPLTTSGTIHLLTLLPPKEANDNIECSLSLALLDDEPAYDALSHVEPIALWADAICINQSDLDKRRNQILQMRRIYASAQQTRIMLGDDDHEAEDVHLCIPFVAALSECYRELERWKAEGREHAMEKMISEMWARFPPSEDIWNFTSAMLSSAWFTRVWTIQELAVASKALIIYGQNQIEWSRLEEAIRMAQLADQYIKLHRRENWFRQENGTLAFHIPKTGTIIRAVDMYHIKLLSEVMPTSLVALRRRVQENNPANLLSALKYACYHKATDPKDKVYALLGLIDEDERERYAVNYSIPVEQAYAAMMKVMLQHDPTMMALCLAGTDQRSTDDLPSWCVDWRTLKRASFDNSEVLDREWLFNATNEDSRQWSAGGDDQELLVYSTQDWRILRIKGTMVGVIGAGRWICSVGDHLKATEAWKADDSVAIEEYYRTELGLPGANIHFENLVDVVSLGT
ncbi:uncharacterized protein LY89DRAFT_718295 [Mollisia scopiformis]|uniref:Heterokaryon incompatibility domain-containing protein n=1 Tax=Mollisia scopiformis TaxID=149040 RepID=A0A194XBU3_MOLSC|nr:uncharacterized protein LY89DRAFT_718295 [Mollisia scopiformis]KUJ17639.1 hypothetical protein LY89DRAFT_718295 [Mollisia scopiformis]